VYSSDWRKEAGDELDEPLPAEACRLAAPLERREPEPLHLVEEPPQARVVSRWRTLTFLAALRSDRIDAPCVIDGPINDEGFLAYIEQVLVPALKPGDIVIIDNLSMYARST
jgi:hypothetical protein